MSVAQLNIEIGARIGQFQNALRGVERDMRRFASNMNQIGNTISQSISLPLAALGVTAIKAAGDFEELGKALGATMSDAGYSAAQAREELELLRKAAEAPGLDFEQAVKASIRLQNVGFSAEKARKTISEMANAIAMSGGSADDLDAVTRQFSQMVSKGRILQEDVGIIAERMPKVATLLKSAFGTASVDALRAQGVTPDQFIAKITEEASKLTRVQGGLKNSIVNAFTAMKAAAASFGDEINRVFGVQNMADELGAKLNSLVSWFKSLDDSTKRFVIEFAAFLVLLGPAVKLIGGMVSVGQSLVTGFSTLTSGVKALASGILGAANSFMSLSTAMKFTVIGAAVAGITALYLAYQSWSEKMSAAEVAQQGVNDVLVKAQQSIVGQKLKVEQLVGVFKNENASYADKKKALDELQKISPQYFGGLDAARVTVEQLARATDRYNLSLLDSAKLEAARSRIVLLSQKELDTQKMLSESEASGWQKLGNYLSSGGNLMQYFAKNTIDAAGNLKENKKAIDLEKKSLEELIKRIEEANTAEGTSTQTTNTSSTAIGNKTKKIKEQVDEMDKFVDELLAMNEQSDKAAYSYLKSQNRTTEALPFADFAISAPALPIDAFQRFADNSIKASESTNAFAESMRNLFGEFRKGGEIAQEMQQSVVGSIVSLTNQGTQSFKEFAAGALSSALQVAKAKAVEGIFSAVSSALKLPFPLNLAAGAVAAAGAGALLNGLTAKIKIPAFADGGVVSGKTLAMVGEYAGAASNPEVIAPLDKLQSIMGGSTVQVTGVLRGDLLRLQNERATARYNRIMGN